MERTYSLSSFSPPSYPQSNSPEEPIIDSSSSSEYSTSTASGLPIEDRVENYSRNCFDGLSRPEEANESPNTDGVESFTKLLEKGGTRHPIWTEEKDEFLRALVSLYGHKWAYIAEKMAEKFPGFIPTRKQCSQHWENFARPGLNRGEWSALELALLRQKFMIYGRSWRQYQNDFPDRSPRLIKSRCERLNLRVLNRPFPPGESPGANATLPLPTPPVFNDEPNAELIAFTAQRILDACHFLIHENTSDSRHREMSEQVIHAQVGETEQESSPEQDSVPTIDDKVVNYTKRRFEVNPETMVPSQLLKRRKTKHLKSRLGISTLTWENEQDTYLYNLVAKYGRKWTHISQAMALRFNNFVPTAKQCSFRWNNHVDPELNTSSRNEAEKALLKEKKSYKEDFPDRSQNPMKNITALDQPSPILQSEDITQIYSEGYAPESDEFDVLNFLA